jgi:hypothetical protein
MANKTKKRLRRAAKKIERQRRAALAARGRSRPGGRIGPDDLFPPSWPDDGDGGAGVREPRRPFPVMPAGAIALDEPESEYLELAANS